MAAQIATLNKVRVELYPAQGAFVQCEDRFTSFIGGIGSGKSFAGAVKMLMLALRRRVVGVVTAPTYPMLRDATLRTYLDLARPFMADWHKSEMMLTLRNGSELLFRSADEPDRLRGPNLHAWHGDEASLYSKDVWPIMIGRLRANGQAGHAWLTTTPKGRNWLYERQAEIRLFRARTRDNPHLAPEFIASLEASYTGQFARQELEGEFVAFEGLVYDEFDRGVHVQRRDGPWRRVVLALDEGYTNPAVILAMGEDNDGRAHVLSEFYRRRVLQGDVVGETKRLADELRPDTVVVDPSAAGLVAELHSVGVYATAANNDVFPGIQGVKGRLARAGDGRPRLTIDPACVNLLAEFESYVWKEHKTTGLKDEPEKANDHAMDALRYGIAALDTRPPRTTTVRNPWT